MNESERLIKLICSTSKINLDWHSVGQKLKKASFPYDCGFYVTWYERSSKKSVVSQTGTQEHYYRLNSIGTDEMRAMQG